MPNKKVKSGLKQVQYILLYSVTLVFDFERAELNLHIMIYTIDEIMGKQLKYHKRSIQLLVTNHSWILAVHKDRIFKKKYPWKQSNGLQKGVEKTTANNGASTVCICFFHATHIKKPSLECEIQKNVTLKIIIITIQIPPAPQLRSH